MKKTRFIALALVVALMLMGAGYAAWSEPLSLTSTVKTGNFNMEITQASIKTGDDYAKNHSHNWHEYDWTHDGDQEVSIYNNKNQVIVEFKDLYPGGCVGLGMTAKNIGTIPAKLKSIKVEFLSGNEALFNALQAQSCWKADIKGDGTYGNSHHVNNWNNWYGVKRELETELINSLNDENVIIEPDGSLMFINNGFKFRLSPSAGNDLQNEGCKFKITFNWEQWSTDPNTDNFTTYGGDGDDY